MSRPKPVVGRDNEYFWTGVADGRVLIQRCTACGNLRHPPSPMCPECQSLDWNTVEATGRATIHTYTVCHHPLPPWEDGPYAVVLLDLEIGESAEHSRLVCGTKGIAAADLKIGMTVHLAFEDGLVFAGPETAS